MDLQQLELFFNPNTVITKQGEVEGDTDKRAVELSFLSPVWLLILLPPVIYSKTVQDILKEINIDVTPSLKKETLEYWAEIKLEVVGNHFSAGVVIHHTGWSAQELYLDRDSVPQPWGCQECSSDSEEEVTDSVEDDTQPTPMMTLPNIQINDWGHVKSDKFKSKTWDSYLT